MKSIIGGAALLLCFLVSPSLVSIIILYIRDEFALAIALIIHSQFPVDSLLFYCPSDESHRALTVAIAINHPPPWNFLPLLFADRPSKTTMIRAVLGSGDRSQGYQSRFAFAFQAVNKAIKDVHSHPSLILE